MGRVVPDGQYSGMWRVAMAHGRVSDRYNLSWAKSHALVAAERELEYDAANTLPKRPEKRVF